MDDTTEVVWRRLLTDGVFFVTHDDTIGNKVEEVIRTSGSRPPLFTKEGVDILKTHVFNKVST